MFYLTIFLWLDISKVFKDWSDMIKYVFLKLPQRFVEYYICHIYLTLFALVTAALLLSLSFWVFLP